jgi:putative ABC transport system ATP-binding protein
MSGAILELRDVVKHYPGGEVVRAVDGVSLELRSGQLVALYGPSGSGKTTLLQIAGGYVRPDRGTVRFGGRDITAFSPRERSLYQRRDVGLVQQRFHLSAGASIIDNAAVKLLADGIPLHEARRHVIPWLERVGLGDRLHHTPGQLSGGEGQRVALARALINEPLLVLADEPTAYLDRRRGREVLSLLASVAHEREAAVLLVTHDPEAAAFADRVHTLSDGRVTAGELPEELAPPSMAVIGDAAR